MRVTTLAKAHEVLFSLRPAQEAKPELWREYHLRCARVYAQVADVDRGHHHEAVYWAGREHRRAQAGEDDQGNQLWSGGGHEFLDALYQLPRTG
jgi:hypothetical protein